MAEHLALYRKWRPLTFDDVFGQEHVTTALKAQITSGRVSHAYLFTGTRGTGKTTCAKILARAVCCEHPVQGSPCNACPACLSVLGDGALDVTEIDAASNNGVDNIREIREEATFAPAALSRRVYIIDEVHMLSPGAFNALLKTLEEPPSHVLFILATTEIHKVPSTILSRCQRYDFRRIPPEIIAARLSGIANAEGISLTKDGSALLARLGDGSMRDAISLLDRCIGTDGVIDHERVTQALGIASVQSVSDIFTALLAGDAATALSLFTDCYLDGRDIVSLFDELLSLVRDIYVLKATGRAEYTNPSGIDSAALLGFAEQADAPTLDYFVSCISDLLTRLTRTAIKRTDGEMCLLKMAARHTFAGATLAMPAPAKPAAVAAPVVTPVVAAPVVTPVAEKPAAPVRTAVTPPPVSTGNADLKSPFIAAVSPKVNSAVRTYLGLGEITAEGAVLCIRVPEESLVFMKKPAVMELFTDTAKQLGYASVKVEKPAPKPVANGIADILQNARTLGVPIK